MTPGLPPIVIVVSRYNGAVTQRLLDGAVSVYKRLGGRASSLTIVEAAGAFEVATLAGIAARDLGAPSCEGVVAIGCIIKGETIHDEVLAHVATAELARAASDSGRPVGLAVLTVNDQAQALARAGGELGNKGAEAMLATLQTLVAKRRLMRQSLGGLERVPSPGATAPTKVADGGAGSRRGAPRANLTPKKSPAGRRSR